MRKRSIVFAVILFGFMVFSACGGNNGDNLGNGVENSIDIWSANSSQKILRDISADDYAYYREAGEYNIFTVRNEYESGQIILTPENDVKSYAVEIFDLVSESGEKLGKECFDVYNQKYIEVTKKSNGKSTGLGWYPDALLPFEKAVEYKENTIKSGENQGIWITLKCPKEQAYGIYTGTFNIIIDGVTHIVPASVTVFDYLLSDTVTAKSCFMIDRWKMTYAGDDTIQAYQAIYEYLLDHRLSAYLLPVIDNDDDMYLESLIKYHNDPRMSAYALPHQSITIVLPSGGTDLGVNYIRLEQTITKIAEYSIRNNVNLLQKAYLEFADVIDEAEIRGITARAVRVAREVEEFKTSLADKLEARTDLSGDKKAEVISKIRNMSNLFTDRKFEGLYQNGTAVKNFCPMFNDFTNEQQRAEYRALAEQGFEYWWYGCTGPHNPYPTYHTDDVLVSSRILRWMQKEYGVSGDLYWCVNQWVKIEREVMTNPYNTANPYPSTNGEGLLLYPGKYYGMITPVGSIRLDSIRDGMEEYEMLAEINEIYKTFDAGCVADEGILKMLYDKLYRNAMVLSDSSLFTRVRKEMYSLAAFAQNYDTAITELIKTANGYTFTVKTKKEVVLKDKDGNTLDAVSSTDDFNIYEISADEKLEIWAEKNGRSQSLSLDLGGSSFILNPLETSGDLKEFVFPAGTGSVSFADPSTATDFGMPGISLAKFSFNNAAANAVQTFSFISDNLKEINRDTVEISFELMCYNSAIPVDIAVYLEFEGQKTILLDIYEIRENRQTVVLSGLLDLTTTWDLGAKLKAIHFDIGSAGDNARTLYIANLVYKVKLK